MFNMKFPYFTEVKQEENEIEMEQLWSDFLKKDFWKFKEKFI